MVKEISKNNKSLFQCEKCQLFYKKKNLAEKCEDWCGKHNSCNISIIKNSIKFRRIT
jgi:hypothetical protein